MDKRFTIKEHKTSDNKQNEISYYEIIDNHFSQSGKTKFPINISNWDDAITIRDILNFEWESFLRNPY